MQWSDQICDGNTEDIGNALDDVDAGISDAALDPRNRRARHAGTECEL